MTENKILKNILANDKINIFFNNLFYVTYYIFVVCLMISRSSLFDINIISLLYSLVTKCTFLLVGTILGYKILSGKFKKYELVLFFIVSLIFGLQFIHARSIWPIVTWVYIYASKGVDYDVLFKKLFIVMCITYFIIVFCSIVGISESYVEMQFRMGIDYPRHAFGFAGYHHASHMMFFIILLYIYNQNEKLNFLKIFVIYIINIIIFLLTNMRANFAYLTITTIFCIIFVLENKNIISKKIGVVFDKFIYIASVLIYLLGPIMIVVLSMLYKKNINFLNKLNHIFTGRLSLTINGIEKYGISLIGKRIRFEGPIYEYVDSGYAYSLLVHGIIVLIMLVIIYMVIAFVLAKKKLRFCSLVLFIIGLYTIFDNMHMSRLFMPYSFLFLSSIDYLQNSKKSI